MSEGKECNSRNNIQGCCWMFKKKCESYQFKIPESNFFFFYQQNDFWQKSLFKNVRDVEFVKFINYFNEIEDGAIKEKNYPSFDVFRIKKFWNALIGISTINNWFSMKKKNDAVWFSVCSVIIIAVLLKLGFLCASLFLTTSCIMFHLRREPLNER